MPLSAVHATLNLYIYIYVCVCVCLCVCVCVCRNKTSKLLTHSTPLHCDESTLQTACRLLERRRFVNISSASFWLFWKHTHTHTHTHAHNRMHTCTLHTHEHVQPRSNQANATTPSDVVTTMYTEQKQQEQQLHRPQISPFLYSPRITNVDRSIDVSPGCGNCSGCNAMPISLATVYSHCSTGERQSVREREREVKRKSELPIDNR